MQIRKIRTISNIILIPLEIHEEGGRNKFYIEKKDSIEFTVIFRNIVNSLSPTLVFFNLNFYVKSFVFAYSLCLKFEIYSNLVRPSPIHLWREVDRSINRVRKSPPQISAFIESESLHSRSTPKKSKTFSKSILHQRWPRENKWSKAQHSKVRQSKSM